MPQKLSSEIAVIGIDIGKNSFHLVGQDRRGGKTCCISFAGWCIGTESLCGLGDSAFYQTEFLLGISGKSSISTETSGVANRHIEGMHGRRDLCAMTWTRKPLQEPMRDGAPLYDLVFGAVFKRGRQGWCDL